MARTKQTARISSGRMAPRRQLATLSTRSSIDDDDVWRQQMETFHKTGRRTIVVHGSAQSDEFPDIINLSFVVAENDAATAAEGVAAVVGRLRRVRVALTTELGIPNNAVSSDSMSTKKRRTEYGSYDDETHPEFVLRRERTSFVARSVVRVRLENGEINGEDDDRVDVAESFGKVCHLLTGRRFGLEMRTAPVYESSRINELRNAARRDACANAREKATALLEALRDDDATLGPPIVVSDLPVDLSDDSAESFLGWGGGGEHDETCRVVLGPEESVDDAVGADAETAKSEGPEEGGEEKLDEEAVAQVFVVPTIRIAAYVRVIFEIVAKDAKNSSDVPTKRAREE